jgi:hypothetical protein
VRAQTAGPPSSQVSDDKTAFGKIPVVVARVEEEPVALRHSQTTTHALEEIGIMRNGITRPFVATVVVQERVEVNSGHSVWHLVYLSAKSYRSPSC